jgi:hypothetical protein
LNPAGFSDLLMQIPRRVTVLSSNDAEVKDVRDGRAGASGASKGSEAE